MTERQFVGNASRINALRSMRTDRHSDDTPVGLYKAAAELLQLADLASVAAVIRRLRTATGESSAQAGVYAEVLDTRLALHKDDLETALRHMELAQRRLAAMEPTPHARMSVLVAEGRMHNATMTPVDGLPSLESAWALREIVDDPLLHLSCALTICNGFKLLERWQDAASWMDTAVELALQSGSQTQVLWLRVSAAGAVWDEGDQLARRGLLDQAHAKWQSAAPLYDRLVSDPACEALSKSQRATLFADCAACLTRVGRSAEALRIVERGFELMAGSEDQALWVAVRLARATILRDLAQWPDASAEAHQALVLAQRYKVAAHLWEAHLLMSSIAEGQGELAVALAHLRSYIKTREEQAFEEAQKRSAAAAVKLQTQRAFDEAEQARQHAARMETEAQVDGLTGLANRRRFDRHLAAEHAVAHLRHLPLCVAMLDVDHFKRVNDGFGHGVGDQVLRRLSEVLGSRFRSGDLVARIGGEEFAVVFSGIGLRRAQDVCERLRAAVEAVPWADLATGLAVTISVGLADVEPFASVAEGLAAVDRLLYEAKACGRNRVVSA